MALTDLAWSVATGSGVAPWQPAFEEKVWTTGTHRVRTPSESWSTVCRVAPLIGITRIADLTGLDNVGIPVASAIRPLARTLAVSAGKGLTTMLAKVSAGMESIELWHAEHQTLSVVTAAAADLALTYPVADLPTPARSLWTDRVRLDWVAGWGLVDGAPVLVPDQCVGLSSVFGEVAWTPATFLRTSNGLASGNTTVEAALHALLELIERDALADLHAGGACQIVKLPSGVDTVDSLFAAFASADNQVELLRLPTRFHVACYVARVRSPAMPLTFTGAGCHVDPEVAACRALTEAAQNRMGVIAGSRDDLDPRIYEWQSEPDRALTPPTITSPAGVLVAGGSSAGAELGPAIGDEIQRERPTHLIGDDLDRVARAVLEVTGTQPMLVDLSGPDIGVPVVRVLAPGLRFNARTVFGRSNTAVGGR
jgi:ribosomal protein S12 methylthiotransferase accessory factor